MYDFYSFYVHLFVTVINCQNNFKLRHERLPLKIYFSMYSVGSFTGFVFLRHCVLPVKYEIPRLT